MGIITFIRHYLRARLSGQPFYALILEPEREWITDDCREVSRDLIADGVNQSVVTLLERNLIYINWTEHELQHIEEQKKRFMTMEEDQGGDEN